MKLWPKITRWDLLIFLGISLLYFTSRLYHLTALPIFVDEAIYSRWAQIALHDASWRFISLTDGKQPLFMWVAMLPLKFIQDPLEATRLVSVVSGWFTVIGLWYAGFLLKDKRTGFLAAGLAVLTPFLFFYDRFATVESMLTAFGVWIFCGGILLAKTKRLDVALLLGMVVGLGLLVKSPAEIYPLLLPFAYLFLKHREPWTVRGVLKYVGLLLVVMLLAEVINNIQRLSPWMYMIARKNGDFVISPLTMLKDHPYRIWQNFVDTQRWLIAYLTLPLYLLSCAGALLLLKSWRRLLLISAWVWGPMTALVSTALLYRPRYLVFLVPFVLLYAVEAIPKKPLYAAIFFLILAVWPIRFMYLAYTDPLHMPLVKADWDYVSGWASGNGVKEIAYYLKSQAGEGKQVVVGTEGTFGLLPHGLELYTDGTPNLVITGYYPVKEIPPTPMISAEKPGIASYFILNNTQVTSTPYGLTEVMSIKKADNSYLRLYRLLP
jgi:4-amino-4-deoxy-L-arabinose transferase-like glycosyltransferase